MHRNTRLTPHSRGLMLERYRQGVSVKALLLECGVSRTTFYRWWRRQRLEGSAGLQDRSSRPRRIHYSLTPEQAEQVLRLRQSTRLGPARLAPRVGAPQIAVYRCLRRRGLNRLPRPPQPPVLRYESAAPGELVHLDVLHLFPFKGHQPGIQFTLVDGHTRMAYASIETHRTTATAVQVVLRAQQAFGFPIRAVLTDNDVTFAPAFRHRNPDAGPSRFTRTLAALGIRHRLTQIRRPQTNGKVERFHRTLRDELYRRLPHFMADEDRRRELAAYLTFYNTVRHHTAINGMTPIQRRDSFFKARNVYTTS